MEQKKHEKALLLTKFKNIFMTMKNTVQNRTYNFSPILYGMFVDDIQKINTK